MQSGIFCNMKFYHLSFIDCMLLHSFRAKTRYICSERKQMVHAIHKSYLSYHILCNGNNHTLRTYEDTLLKAWKCISVGVRSLDTNVNKWCMQFISRRWQPVLLSLSYWFIHLLLKLCPSPSKTYFKGCPLFQQIKSTSTV